MREKYQAKDRELEEMIKQLQLNVAELQARPVATVSPANDKNNNFNVDPALFCSKQEFNLLLQRIKDCELRNLE